MSKTKTNHDALSYEVDIALRSHKSEIFAWLVAGAAVILAIIALICVAVMLPLKQVVPYMVYVDKTTGATQVVSVVDARNITNDEINAQYWMARYVTARESYLYKVLQGDYNLTMALSAPNIAAEYSSIYEEPNKKDARWQDAVEERIRIISVQPTPGVIGRGTVRFEKTTWRTGMRQPEKSETMLADLAFEWRSITGWDNKDLLLNPLGFTVTAYRTTTEIAR